MKRQTTLSIGEFSNATLLPQDIFPELAWILSRIRLSCADRGLLNRLQSEFEASQETQEGGETASECLSDLFDLAERYAPEACYVGSLEGDGACFGVWPLVDVARELAEENPESYGFEVNDHGNVTFSARRGNRSRVIWAIV